MNGSAAVIFTMTQTSYSFFSLFNDHIWSLQLYPEDHFLLLFEATFLINDLNYCPVCFQVEWKAGLILIIKINSFWTFKKEKKSLNKLVFFLLVFGHFPLWISTMSTALGPHLARLYTISSFCDCIKWSAETHKHTTPLRLVVFWE